MKKKILYVHHGGGQGGAPNSLLYLIKNLNSDRYEPIIACDFNAKYAKEFFVENGFNPVNIPVARFSHFFHSWWPIYKLKGIKAIIKWLFLRYPRSVKKFKKALKEISPDIIHLNSLSIAPLAFVAKRMGFPVVLHVRESAIKLHNFDLRWSWLKWLANNYADKVIYICQDNQNKLTGNTRISSVIYNPVPFDKFDRNIDSVSTRKLLGIPLNTIVLFFPGGSSMEVKGISPFLLALSKIRKKHSTVSAIITKINEPSRQNNIELQKIEEMILRLELEDAIIRLPFTNSVEQYFAASDIIVTPFIVPHFSRAAIEAGAMTKPVVGSRIGGIEEVVEDGVTGFLAKPGDAKDLTDKLFRLISDPNKIIVMGLAGFKKASKLYRADYHAKAVMQIYDEIDNSKR